MAVFIAVWVIGFIIVFRMATEWGEFDFVTFIQGTVANVLVGGMIAALLNLMTSPFVETEWSVESEHRLAAIQDGVVTSGSFFLGTGTVDGDPKFIYYQMNGNGGYTLESLSPRYATVFQEDGEPRVVEYNGTSDNPWISLMPKWGTDYKAEFYVPEGSIINNYTLDAK